MTADPTPCTELITQLLTAANPATALQQKLLNLQENSCVDDLATALKEEADHFLRTDLQQARQWAQLLFDLADLTDNSLYQALGLRAQGNIHLIGEYDCPTAITCYEDAESIYTQNGRSVEAAQSLVGKVGALYFMGHYQEAIVVGETARHTLKQQAQWRPLTGLLLNMAAIHRRLGQGAQAVALLTDARTICQETGADAELPGIELNRANVLCDMGQLQNALEAGKIAEKMFVARQQPVAAARAQMSQGIATYQMGHYNEALNLFDQARSAYLLDERYTDALLVDRYASDLLLQLGHYQQVINICADVRTRYQAHNIPYEVAQAIRNEAIAFAGLGQLDQALTSLAEARDLLTDNPARTAVIDLETAVILTQQQRYPESLATAVACQQHFQEHDLRIQAAQADFVAAQAATRLDQQEQAYIWCRRALTVAQEEGVPWLTIQAHHLLAKMAQADQAIDKAIENYEHAMTTLETLRGHLMVELRADFLLNKQQVYEDAVVAYLQNEQTESAFKTIERAKSQALTDLLAHQLDLQIKPRRTTDQKLLNELTALRERRNQLYRQWQTAQDIETQSETRAQITQLEAQITALWQRLLIRNADYARDADLLHGYTDTFPLPLDKDTLLIEYFIAQGELIVVLIADNQVEIRPLPGVLAQLIKPARLLNLNLKAATALTGKQILHLKQTAQKYLAQLHHHLITPIQDRLAEHEKLIIVPHGALLHYLPFAALYDGHHYLIEKHALSYLPNAGLLHYLPQPTKTNANPAVFGNSANGRLPHAVDEAQTIAHLLAGDAYLEDSATITQLQTIATQAPILHLATHADFNQENPLFSGLHLADGQLTTLDLFHLQLNADLVTLSACQTGRSVVSGGDELLGLMRAFLYAGAASLLLTHWRVHDETTPTFMAHFYQNLFEGQNKAEALRQAQLIFILSNDANSHPAHWGAFFLVGATNPLNTTA